ncbi:MAG: PQ-loop domain-containing transporter [Clostridiales bacterium]|nr:PQ-loop domain-containing transporter [Clostridiales bacterium]
MNLVLESFMLICFGFSWPINVYKAYKSESTKGISIPFLVLIITGYICGISAKLISGQVNYVLVVYVINLVMVSLNFPVYIRNRRIEKGKVYYVPKMA